MTDIKAGNGRELNKQDLRLGRGCCGCISIGIALFVCLLLAYPVSMRMSARDITITVQKSERVTTGEASKYMVWAEEGEVFEDSDSLLFWKFNSSDLYGQLKVGHTYNVRVVGWRIRFLSGYRNIIRINKEVSKDPAPQ